MIRFIHIPKTGGAAVRQYLLDNNIEHKFGSKKANNVYAKKHRYASYWLEKYSGEKNIDYFCVVRNPYTRLASYYRYVIKHNALSKSVSWEEFVKNKIDFQNHYPWDLQINWIYDKNYSTKLVTNIFKFENLENDVNKFFRLKIPMKQVNVTNSGNINYMQEYYHDKEIRDIVTEHFVKDFVFLDYDIIM